MGKGTKVLLVDRRALIAGAACTALLAACGRDEPSVAAAVVDPRDYDSFFLWAGVREPDLLARAKTVYLLAGELRHGDRAHYVRLRDTPRAAPGVIWLTVRAEWLDWHETVHRAVLTDLQRWERADNRLAGLQVDFDAATLGLEGYAEFLEDLRTRLPARWKLSVTGLMDWSAQGDARALARLSGTVDEVVIQTYQGRRTIPGYETYLRSLARLPLPFRIGLVEGGMWREPDGIATNPNFRGYVVFLLPG